MSFVHKNVISFLLGSLFSYLFVWLIGIVATAPVPEFLQPYDEFVLLYYSNILTVLISGFLALCTLLVVRKAFTVFSKQNVFYFTLPIVLFIAFLMLLFNFAVITVMLAALPTLLVALLISQGVQTK